MQVGLMWYSDPKNRETLGQRVRAAALRHLEKYGSKPTLCFVSVSMFAEYDGLRETAIHVPSKCMRVVVRTAPNMPKDHLWIGIGSDKVMKGGDTTKKEQVTGDQE